VQYLIFLVWWLLYIPPGFNIKQFLQIIRSIALKGRASSLIAIHWPDNTIVLSVL
jgi:hypothetical protein